MQIIHDTATINVAKGPIALTIGMFDGLHLGHQAVLSHLIEKKKHSIVLTFSNHPLEILHQKKIPHLTTLAHRLELLAQAGVDTAIVIPFTHTFSKQSAKVFLSYLKQLVPFSDLVLGYDATIGHERKGDRSQLVALALLLNFTLEYIDPILIDKITISSSRIRRLIEGGSLEKVSRLLGRRYSILTRVEQGSGKGRLLGFQTANGAVEGLSLPPFGVYAVHVIFQKQCYLGVANLGYAPTVHTHRPAFLEVHLLECNKSLYGEEIEVIFLKYLRAERCFPTPERLIEQIKKDIAHADRFFVNSSIALKSEGYTLYQDR